MSETLGGNYTLDLKLTVRHSNKTRTMWWHIWHDHMLSIMLHVKTHAFPEIKLHSTFNRFLFSEVSNFDSFSHLLTLSCKSVELKKDPPNQLKNIQTIPGYCSNTSGLKVWDCWHLVLQTVQDFSKMLKDKKKNLCLKCVKPCSNGLREASFMKQWVENVQYM